MTPSRQHHHRRRLQEELAPQCSHDVCDGIRWQHSWSSLRTFRITGPIRIGGCIQPEQLKLFGKQEHLGFHGAISDGRHVNTLGQVSAFAARHMRYAGSNGSAVARKTMQGKWEANWSAFLVDGLVAQAKRDHQGVSPGDYGYAALQCYRALSRHAVRGLHVMVAGSISPWLEAIAISRGAASVSTVDYIAATTTSPRLKIFTMADLYKQRGKLKFDAILSYSSIEHDGLGRYGDPINPFGDVAALGEFALMLKPGGLLFLGIPVSRRGSAMQGQRFYDSHRFHILTRGWDLLATHSPIPSCICGNLPEHVVKNGAPYCCPGNITFRERIATWNGSSFWDPPLDGIGVGPKEHWTNQPLFVLRRTPLSLSSALETVRREIT